MIGLGLTVAMLGLTVGLAGPVRDGYASVAASGNGNGNSNDNNAIIVEILKLREESAKLLGFPTYAAYRLEDSMAKTPQAVRGLLERVWKPARARAFADRDALQALVDGDRTVTADQLTGAELASLV